MTSFLPQKIAALYRPSRPLPRQMSVSLTNKGLLNPSGHNNCFLNSCVQVLWHVDVFRRSFRKFKGHSCVGKSCIFCALQSLFTQFQHSDQSALPPDELRGAMADCYQEEQRFQLGLMDDAAECFEKILEQIHFHLTGNEDLDTCSAPYCISHQKCALSILEMTECSCGETSEPLAFVQFVHYISASSLGAAAQKRKQLAEYPLGDGALFGELLKTVSAEGEARECAECHKLVPLKKMLLNNPDVVCFGLIWDSDRPDVQHIMNTVQSIGLLLRLSDVFDMVVSDAKLNEYQLTALVAYYGRHYSTFCYHSVLREWVYFDDAKFRTVSSSWADVVELCRKAHYQPLLLVYTNPFAEQVDMTCAPVGVRMVSAVDAMQKGTKPLAPVVEEDNKAAKNGVTSPPPPVSASSSQPAAPPSKQEGDVEGSKSSSSSFQEQQAYHIDPMTLSVRPIALSGKPASGSQSIYPHLPGQGGEREMGKGGGSEGGDLMEFSVRPSAPPLHSTTHTATPTTHKATPTTAGPSTRMPPAVIQPSARPPLPSSTPHSRGPPTSTTALSYPVHFQPSPTPPSSYPPASGWQRPPTMTTPPSHTPSYAPHSYGASRTTQALPGYPPQRGYYSVPPSSSHTGGYPPPTNPRYPSPWQPHRPHQPRPPPNSGYVYPTNAHPPSPWRGTQHTTNAPTSTYPPPSHGYPLSFHSNPSPNSSPPLQNYSPPNPGTHPPLSHGAVVPYHGQLTVPSAGMAGAGSNAGSVIMQGSSPLPAYTQPVARPRPSPQLSTPPPPPPPSGQTYNTGSPRVGVNSTQRTSSSLPSSSSSSSPASLPKAAVQTRHPAQSNASTPATLGPSSSPSSGPHSMPASGGGADLIEFSLSPVALMRPVAAPTASNQVQQSQGHPIQGTTGPSQQRNPTTSSISSGSSATGDLIQWSISPDQMLRLQSRYRGRHEAVRRNVVGSVQSSPKAVQPGEQASVPSENQFGQTDSTLGATTSQSTQHQSAGITNLVQPVSTVAQPTSTDTLSHGVLVEVEGQVGGGGKVEGGGEAGGEGRGREVATGRSAHSPGRQAPPTPWYAEADEVSAVLPQKGEEEGGGGGGVKESSVPAKSEPDKQVSEARQSRFEEGHTPPIGNDPLYAVPEQVKAKLRAAGHSPNVTPSPGAPPSAGGPPSEGSSRSTAHTMHTNGRSRDTSRDTRLTSSGEHLKPGAMQDKLGVAGGQTSYGKHREGEGKAQMFSRQLPQEGRGRVERLPSPSESSTPNSDIPESVRPDLLEALSLWRKAETRRESDVMVALMSYSRTATLLLKVLMDPAVARDPSLYQNISKKRGEALARWKEMKEKYREHQHSSSFECHGECSQCGQTRDLNDLLLCGPCQLKAKMKLKA